jgi:hypothetical protein
VIRAFIRTMDGIAVHLTRDERALIGSLPDLLAGVGESFDDPGAARLSYVAHREDQDAEAGFHALTDDELLRARAADRERLIDTVEHGALSADDADAWLRVIGEARLVLASRLGITEDGWEAEIRDDEPVEMTLVRLLGALQDELVTVLLG